jgi:antitoxin (DNA-binding transcriptional repressor) of toxin-antitoxin stability system
MKTVTVTEAARNFSELVSRVHYQGETALLIKGGRPMAKVTPARRPRTGRDLALVWPTLPRLDAREAKAFDRDLSEARRRLPEIKSKWD